MSILQSFGLEKDMCPPTIIMALKAQEINEINMMVSGMVFH